MNITMCQADEKCIIRQHCHRWENSSIKNYDKYQYYFDKPPFKIKKGEFECDMFWGDKSKYNAKRT